LEALADLSPEQIDAGCENAIKTAERFPAPGHIRKAVPFDDRTSYLGPPLLEYNETLTPEERAEALKFSEALKKKLGIPAKPVAEPKKLTIVPSLLSLEEQKAELRRKGFLK
jgi:hypothetical protein